MSSGDSSDNDKFNNKFGDVPPVKEYKSAFAQAKVSDCHVQAPPIHPGALAPPVSSHKSRIVL